MRIGAILPDADPETGQSIGAPSTTPPAGARQPGLQEQTQARPPRAAKVTDGKAGIVSRVRNGLRSLQRSPLTRRIIATNLLSVFLLLIAGLAFDPSGNHLLYQREAGLVSQSRLVADVLQVQAVRLGTDRLDRSDVELALSMLDLGAVRVIVFDPDGQALGTAVGKTVPIAASSVLPHVNRNPEPTWSTRLEHWMQDRFNALLARFYPPPAAETPLELARRAFAKLVDQPVSIRGSDAQGAPVLTVAAPVMEGETRLGVVTLTGNTTLVQILSRARFHWGVQVFAAISAVSVVLSLALGVTIAKPLNELAEAADLGREWHAKDQQRVGAKLTDLTETPGEIGRLSQAMRGMVDALYLRIESNEQFAADVSHEIKNPLASLRSAVGALRVAQRDNQREALMAVIEHDVRRLDRLVTDISNASRLDSDLVKEQEEVFDLVRMLGTLTDHLSRDAARKGVEMIADLPGEEIGIRGLEERLAQVFVNLIGNAVSFCEDGDAVRIWVRRRENRVLVVVEDTGPGIPDQALSNIFKRFYSERPTGDFGNHSGLGLAISKQIVEAHGGVIWAENIRPTDADVTSDPLGARFVVGLPV